MIILISTTVTANRSLPVNVLRIYNQTSIYAHQSPFAFYLSFHSSEKRRRHFPHRRQLSSILTFSLPFLFGPPKKLGTCRVLYFSTSAVSGLLSSLFRGIRQWLTVPRAQSERKGRDPTPIILTVFLLLSPLFACLFSSFNTYVEHFTTSQSITQGERARENKQLYLLLRRTSRVAATRINGSFRTKPLVAQ